MEEGRGKGGKGGEGEWEYDPRAECPVRGALVSGLESSKLSFFWSTCEGR